jgi:hypothetical protein
MKTDSAGFMAGTGVSRNPVKKGGLISTIGRGNGKSYTEQMTESPDVKDKMTDTGYKFNRQPRILITEEIANSKYQANALLYKDKGNKRPKIEIKGASFGEASAYERKAFNVPGPGAYDVWQGFNASTLNEKPPQYSQASSGLVQGYKKTN